MSEKIYLDLNRVQLPMSDSGMAAGVTNPVKSGEGFLSEALSQDNKIISNHTAISSTEPKLLEYGIDLNKPFKITKEMVKKMRAKGKKGFWETLKDNAKNAIPFLSGFLEIKKNIDLVAIIKKQQKGEKLSNQEKETLYLYLLEQVENEHRGSSFMGKVGEMLSHLPAFAGEFFLTGGLYSLGKNLAGKAASKLLGDVAKKQFLTRAIAKGAGVAVGAGFRTVALSNTYSGIVARRLKTDTSKLDENGLGEVELKETDESMAASIGKGLLDGYIETVSEQSGEGFSKIFGKIPFLGKILVPEGKAGAFMAKTGFNGLFEEYAEERFGGTLRVLTGLDERENVSFGEKLYDAIVPGWEQTGVEFTTTALWGGALSTGHYSVAKAKQFVKNAAQNEKVKDAVAKATMAVNDAIIAASPYVQTGLAQIPAIPVAAAQLASTVPLASSTEALLGASVIGADNRKLIKQFTPANSSAKKAIIASIKNSALSNQFFSKKIANFNFLRQDSIPQDVKELQDKINKILAECHAKKPKKYEAYDYKIDSALADYNITRLTENDDYSSFYVSKDLDVLKLQYIYVKAVAEAYPEADIERLFRSNISENSENAKLLVDFIEKHPDIPAWAVRNIIEANNSMSKNSKKVLLFNLWLAEKYMFKAQKTEYAMDSWGVEEIAAGGIPQISLINKHEEDDFKTFKSVFENIDDADTAKFFADYIIGVNDKLYNLSTENCRKIISIVREKGMSEYDINDFLYDVGGNLENIDLFLALYDCYIQKPITDRYLLRHPIEKACRVPEVAKLELEINAVLAEYNRASKQLSAKEKNALNQKIEKYKEYIRINDWALSLVESITYKELLNEGFLDIQKGKNGYFMIPSGLLYNISELSPKDRLLFKEMVADGINPFDALDRIEQAEKKLKNDVYNYGKPNSQASWREEKYKTMIFVPERSQQLGVEDIFGMKDMANAGVIDEKMWQNIKKRGLLALKEFESNGVSTGIEDIIRLSNLSDKDFEKLRPLFYIKGRKTQLSFGSKDGSGKMFSELSKQQILIAKELAYIPQLGENQLGEKEICAIVKAPDKTRQAIIESHILQILSKNDKISVEMLENMTQLSLEEIASVKQAMEKYDYIFWSKIPNSETLKNAVKLLEYKEKYPNMLIFQERPLCAITMNDIACKRAVELIEKINPNENSFFREKAHLFIKSKADIDDLVKLSGKKYIDGRYFIESSMSTESLLEEPELVKKVLYILENSEVVPDAYAVKLVASEDKRFDIFKKTKDAIASDGKPVGGNIAFVLAYKSDIDEIQDNNAKKADFSLENPDIQLLFNTKMKNGEPMFSRTNIADIIMKIDGLDNAMGINLSEFVVEQLKDVEDRKIVDFASQNIEILYTYGLKVILNMSKYSYMNEGDALKEFLKAQAEAVAKKNVAVLTGLVGFNSTPEQIKEAIEYFKSLLNDSLNYKLLDKINSLPVSNRLKLKLATNNLYITESGLDKAIKYFKSLDKAKLAECSDENIADIITLKATEIFSNGISDNLGLLRKVTDLQGKLNQTEKELFSAELEKTTARIARALSQVITPAKVTSEDTIRFFRGFGLNADNLSNGQTPDSVLSSTEFGKFLHANGKNGIKLSLSRSEFINELNNILKNSDEKQMAEIIRKIGIEFTSRVAKLNEVPNIQAPSSTFVQKTYSAEELEKFEKEKLSGYSTSSVELNINGKTAVFTKYEGTQGGSNEGYMVKAQNGELFYIKFPSSEEAAAQEVLASMLYREAGILAPEITFVKTSDGKAGIASKIIPTTHNITSPNETAAFQQGFAVDAWLANWDILKNNNAVFSDSDHTCARMDVGGSLEYRARGDKKNSMDFDYKVRALSSLISNNNGSPLVQIDIPTMLSSMERVLSLSDEKIIQLTAKCKCPDILAETLIARKRYIANIYNQLKNIQSDKLVSSEMLENMDKKISYDNGNSFNGILTNLKLDKNNPVEKQVYDLIQKFMYENELQIENPEIKELMTQLVKAFPEYMSIIGKKQHSTHSYSLDGHMLTVLNKALNAPEYAALSKIDKLVLKLSIIFHDISKAENQKDSNHPKVSSMYARDILKRVKLPVHIKERIVEFIENHHWFKLANSKDVTETDMKKIAARFRRNNDLVLAKIFAEADLSSINTGFEKGRIENLPATFEKLKQLLQELNYMGSFTYTTPFVRKLLGNKALTSYTRDGHTYNISVLNFSNNTEGQSNTGTIITDKTDLRDFGFVSPEARPVSRQSLSFMAHCTNNPMDIYYLSDISADSDLCTSNITLDNLRFYDKVKPSGVLLQITEQANVGSSIDKNQGSGGYKTFVNFASEIWAYSRKDGSPSEKKENAAIFRRSAFIDFMNQKGISLSEDEYAEIHRIFLDKIFLSHIHDIKLSNGRIIKEKDIKAAIEYVDNKIRADKLSHNETNIYAPKVMALFAAEDTLDKVPQKILLMAEELGLPIFLFGKTKKKLW